MSLITSVFTNLTYVMLGRAGFRFLTGFAMIYAARYFGPGQYGMLEIAIAWSNAVMTLSDIGMSTLIIREASRDESKAGVYFGNTLIVQTIMSGLILIGLILMGFIAGYSMLQIMLIAIIGAAGLIFEYRKVMRSILRVVLELRFISILEVINGILFFSSMVCLFVFTQNRETALLGFGIAQLIINTISIIVLQIYTLRFVKPHIDIPQIPEMLKASWVFTLYNVFAMLYFQVDQITLSFMTDSTTVGIYSSPTKLASILLFVPMMLYQITLPLMYRYSTQDPEKYKRITTLSYRYIAALGVPMGLGLTLLAEPVIQLVFGADYAASVPVMQWMGIFLIIRFISISVSNILTTSDKQGLLAGIQVVSVIFNVIMNILLIPHYGALGPAIATLITEIITTAVYIYFTWSIVEQTIGGLFFPLIPVSLAAAAMAGMVLLAQGMFHAIVVVIFGAIIYLFALVLFQFFTVEDRAIIQSLLKRKTL